MNKILTPPAGFISRSLGQNRIYSSIRILCGIAPMTFRLMLLFIVFSLNSYAQNFDSGSDGSDGALDFTDLESGTVVDFDPTSFDPTIDVDGNNVFHFTTITIPKGITVLLRADKMQNAPVYWLATGAVDISGVVDLNGERGHNGGLNEVRFHSIPGPGGYLGGLVGTITSTNGQSGFGPGRGEGGSSRRGSGGEYQSYTNIFLLPLLGGSGGGGGAAANNTPGTGGGAGAGSILIASSESIIIDGRIESRGGQGGQRVSSFSGGGGSGGGIRILAPVIGGSGRIDTRGGTNGYTSASSPGRIRLEAHSYSFTGTIIGSFRAVKLPPNPIILPSVIAIPAVQISTIDGINVPINPSGTFLTPDVIINNDGTVTLQITTQNIPLGTMITLRLDNQNEGTQTVPSTPIEGTFVAGTATATATFSTGFSQVITSATWE